MLGITGADGKCQQRTREKSEFRQSFKTKRDTLRLPREYCLQQPRSRKSAKRFSSRWNWDSPTPLATGECAPPPFGPGGRAHSLAAEGVGESQFQRGDIHCGAL
jgi:hypothetical protein